ncbi:MAG: mandelate racemase/muconate lactonizing enzyme family protein, partial [Acidimicrobiia bacterium]
MRIVSVDTFPISIPLVTPVRMSHVTIVRSNNVLVKIMTDDGVVGWGEGVEAMDLTGESQTRIKASIDTLGELLVGKNPLARTDRWLALSRRVHENTTAIGALDIALHDIAGKMLGVPVYQLLGGAVREEIPALTLIGSGDADTDLATFYTKYEAGYRWFKLKLGIGDQRTEVKTVNSILSAVSDVVFCGDVNAGWDEYEALRFLKAIEGLPVRFIEQPTRHRRALLRVAEASPIAICADESARSLRDIADLSETAIAGVSLK